jgi:hypothetical protein
MLIAGHERGALPPERIAELLGCVGHGSGYPTVHALLRGSEEPDVCAAAGVACARLLGSRAEADLLLALNVAELRATREGAALGLCELGTAEAAASVAEAGRVGRIRIRVAARCAARMPFDADLWLSILEAPDSRSRRLATEVVYELLAHASDHASVGALDDLGQRGKQAVRRALEDTELYMLPDKRELLARWAGR